MPRSMAQRVYVDSLYHSLLGAMHRARRDGDSPNHWVMSGDWLVECQEVIGPDGFFIWKPEGDYGTLFDFPVYVVSHRQSPVLIAHPYRPERT